MISPASSWFLLALIFAAIPVVLYLLFRLRKRNVEWGASYILQLTIKEKKKESRWRQYVILALRTLLLALVALAFCRPLLKGLTPFGNEFPRGGTGSLTRVILLDNSDSMAARFGNQTRYAEAQQLAALLLQGVTGGDSFVVIPLAGDQKPLEFRPPYKPEKVRERLAAIPPVSTPINVEKAIERAYRHFLTAVTTNRQLFVLSDFAGRDFPEPASLHLFARSLRDIGVACYFHAINRDDDANVSIQQADFGTDTLLAGETYNLYVELANVGARPRSGDNLMLLEGAKVLQRVDFDLTPNERKTMRLPVALPEGSHALELRIGDDVYPVDNQLFFSVAVRKSLAVLMLVPVSDQTKGFESESEFLQRAIESAGRTRGTHFQLEIRNATTVTAADLARCQVVIVPGTPLGNKEIIADLKRFLRRGGGLIIGLSPDVDRKRYAALLHELAGVELLDPYVEKVDYERHLFIQKMNIPDDLLREFGTNLNADLSKARIYDHFRTRLDRGGPAVALLRLSNGDPALISAPYGRGRVILWTSTLGGRWSSLVVHQPFLPLVCRLLDAASAGATPPRNVARGEPIIYPVTEPGALFVTTPANQLVQVKLVAADGKRFVRFEQTQAAGLYTLTDKDGRTVQCFSVAPNRVESDLTSITPAVRADLAAAFDTQFTRTESDLRARMVSSGYTLDMTSFIALAILGLVLVETVLLRIWF